MTGGLFITIDGPSGAGKTTLAHALASALRAKGQQVVQTSEPSPGPAGQLARQHLDRFRGNALACLVTADRYDHLTHTIRPALRDGAIVICDRYVPSSMVLQAVDGCDPAFIHALNHYADPPDLAVIISAPPDLLQQRLHTRGTHGRFSHQPGISHTETIRYQQTADLLQATGIPLLLLDSTNTATQTLAAHVIDAVPALSSRLHP